MYKKSFYNKDVITPLNKRKQAIKVDFTVEKYVKLLRIA